MWMEELSNGKYKFIERYKDPYTEKDKRVSVTLNSKSNQARKQAQKELDEKIVSAINLKTKSNLTLDELINEWWKQHKQTVRPSSVVAYQKIIDYIKNHIGTDALIKNTDTKFFQTFINDLPHSFEYSKKFKSVLNMAFNYALDMEYITINPITRVSVSKPADTIESFESTSDKYLEKEEVARLLEVLRKSHQSVPMARLAEFMYLTGVRFGEAVSLTKEDIDLDSKLIVINGTLDYSSGYKDAKKQLPKTMSSFRTIGVSKRVIEILEELTLEQRVKFKNETTYLFVGKTGKPIQLNSFNASLNTANDKLGKERINKKISSHIFRHSHISLLAELDVNIKTIMERVGHSDVDTTMKIYTHVTKKSKASVIDRLDSIEL